MAQTNEEKIEEEKRLARFYANTLVLDPSKRRILKLLDFKFENDNMGGEYYWVFMNEDGKIERVSCLINSWTPLKDYINDQDYRQMVENWNKECDRKKVR